MYGSHCLKEEVSRSIPDILVLTKAWVVGQNKRAENTLEKRICAEKTTYKVMV